MTTLISVEAVWRGVIVGIGPCIAAKVLSAFFVGEDRWVIGFAMVGRGEFAYLVAQTAVETKMSGRSDYLMSKEAFAVVVWALLMASISAPIMFKVMLSQKEEARKAADEAAGVSQEPEDEGPVDPVAVKDYLIDFRHLNYKPSSTGGDGH